MNINDVWWGLTVGSVAAGLFCWLIGIVTNNPEIRVPGFEALVVGLISMMLIKLYGEK